MFYLSYYLDIILFMRRNKLKDNQVRIAYKSQIKLSSDDKLKIDTNIFIINQLYNFLIDLLSKSEIQEELVSLKYGEYIEYKNKNNSIIQKFVITKNSKVRNYIYLKFIKYMENRKLSVKGLSKPIQLKLEAFIDTYNKINLSPQKSHNYKFSSPDNQGSYETDSSIKLIKKRLKKNNGKKFTKYFIKIGMNLFEFRNKSLNIKHFDLKKVSITRKNHKYYVSLSGIKSINKLPIKRTKYIGIDVNFETINLSSGKEYKTNNLQNKLNLFTLKLKEYQQKRSKRIELNLEVLKTLCNMDNIYVKLNKKINKLYAKRTNTQNDYYNKIINKITSSYDLFFIEKLNIENMINKEISNKNLYNASLSKFLIMLKNKINILGKVYEEVESYNTSKRCHKCKKINQNITFKNKEWKCEYCGIKHNRDYNASKNIENLGLELFYNKHLTEKDDILEAELKSI